MEVILLEKVARLGSIGEVVNVRPGFARNYLIPQEKALRATQANKAVFEARADALAAKDAERKAEAEKLVKSIEGVTVTVIRQASEGGQLYGSVAVRDIADALEAEGHTIDRSLINLNQAIKALGLYEVSIRPHADVETTIRVHVARNADSPIPEELLVGEVKEEEALVSEATVEEAIEVAAAAEASDAETPAEVAAEVSEEAEAEEKTA